MTRRYLSELMVLLTLLWRWVFFINIPLAYRGGAAHPAARPEIRQPPA